MNGLWRLFVRTWVVSGECTYLLTWKPGDQPYSTCVLPIDPDRVSNPNMRTETATIRGGVEMAPDGTPLAYHVREAHAADWWSAGKNWTWTRVQRQTSWGRPVFVHGFEPDREGQTRAITPFASLVSRLRMIGKHADHELAAAAANALFSAFVESDLPADEVQQRLAQGGTVADRKSYAGFVMNWFDKFPAKVAGVRIPVMPPGTKVTMNSSPRQTTAFPAFQTAFLHSIAASLNISYEQLTMDWSRVNYSSARAALNEVWRSIQRMSSAFVEQVVQPVFYAVVEEAFDKGYIAHPHANDNGEAPDFWAAPAAYLRARWIGPFRGSVDPLKEAEASGMRMELMTSTLEIECAALGHDYLDILDQAAVEQEEIAARGLTRRSVVDAVRSARGPLPTNPEVEDGDQPDDAGPLQDAA
jgi:lambda family phage portal protein